MEIVEYSITKNFWEIYPGVKNLSPFKKFRLDDKKRDHALSSKLMWAFAVFVDLSAGNPLKDMPDEEKITIIEADYINVKFDLDKYSEHITLMRKLLLPLEYVALNNLIQKLNERTKLIQETEYTIDNAKKLDELIANTEILLIAIKKMEASIAAGSSDGMVKGGRQESIGEKGVI